MQRTFSNLISNYLLGCFEITNFIFGFHTNIFVILLIDFWQSSFCRFVLYELDISCYYSIYDIKSEKLISNFCDSLLYLSLHFHRQTPEFLAWPYFLERKIPGLIGWNTVVNIRCLDSRGTHTVCTPNTYSNLLLIFIIHFPSLPPSWCMF